MYIPYIWKFWNVVQKKISFWKLQRPMSCCTHSRVWQASKVGIEVWELNMWTSVKRSRSRSSIRVQIRAWIFFVFFSDICKSNFCLFFCHCYLYFLSTFFPLFLYLRLFCSFIIYFFFSFSLSSSFPTHLQHLCLRPWPKITQMI